MVAVRDECRAVDLSTNLDAEHSYRFVAKKSDQTGEGKPTQMQDDTGMEEPANSLVSRHQGAEQNDQDDGEAGEVLDPSMAIGNAQRGLRLASAKAIQSGIAVPASAMLWMVSASSATLPEK